MIRRKPMVILLLTCCCFVFAQSPGPSYSLEISPDETILEICAGGSGYGLLTAYAVPGEKHYFVRTGHALFGPFDEVTGLQYSFNDSVLIFGARTDTNWTVYEGEKRYGPFRSLQKIRSGTKDKRLLFLADENLYERENILAGESLYTPCTGFELSQDGRDYVFVEDLILSQRVYKNTEPDDFVSLDSICTLRMFGGYVGIHYRRTLLDQFLKDKLTYGAIVYHSYGGSGEFTFKDELSDCLVPGDIAFYEWARGDIRYYYSFKDSAGTWKLFNKDTDMQADQKEIKALCVLPSDKVVYAAKPCRPGAQNLDVNAFYVFSDNAALGGPFEDVRQIVCSEGGTSIAVAAKAQGGWNIVLQGAGFGPFAKVEDLAYFGETALGFRALYDQEWRSFIITAAGIQQGALIRVKGKVTGLAHLNGTRLNIYTK